MNALLDPQNIVLITARISSIGVVLSCMEYLAEPALLKDDGLMTWQVGRLRMPWLALGLAGAALNVVLAYPNVLILVGLRAVVGAATALGPNGLVAGPWIISLQAFLSLVFIVRTRYGHDGADQMALIIFISLALAQMAATPGARIACLWFLTLQLCLSYLVAGIAKASATGWRDGTYITGICGSGMYGNARLARFLASNSTLGRLLGRFIFVWECCFPVVLLVPLSIALAILATGAVFHLVIAYVMGLNTFVWSFLAIYPAVLYCIQTRGW